MNADWCTPDICDDNDSALILDFPWLSFGKAKFCGEVTCVALTSDNKPLKTKLDEQGNNRVLLVWAGGSGYGAVVGDRVATKALENGWSGLVILGRIRDTHEIRDIDIGVFALGKYPRKLAAQLPPPPSDLTELFQKGNGGMLFADCDGVVIIPKAQPD